MRYRLQDVLMAAAGGLTVGPAFMSEPTLWRLGIASCGVAMILVAALPRCAAQPSIPKGSDSE